VCAAGPAGGSNDACRLKPSVDGTRRHTCTLMPRRAAKAAQSMGPAHEVSRAIQSAYAAACLHPLSVSNATQSQSKLAVDLRVAVAADPGAERLPSDGFRAHEIRAEPTNR